MTEPLTPPECDLRGLSFMPLDVVRLTDSDLFALATGDEFKAAVTLWCKAWLQVPAGSLPDDERILAHLSGAGAKWRRIKPMAMRGFIQCSDGRWYHPVISEKAREAWCHRLKQRKKAAKRWDKQGNSHGSPAGDATASAPAMQGTGTGTVVPFSNENGATVDSDKAFWDTAKSYLGKSKASLIGQWVRDHGKAETAAAITAAQLDRAVDPVEFIQGRFRKLATETSVVIGV